MDKKIVTVDLGGRSYDIIIGHDMVADFATHLKKTGSYSKIFVITDENVSRLHLQKFSSDLKNQNIEHQTITLEAGEKTKNFSNLQNLSEKILESGIDRGALLIAFGGGVIGDLCGFVASILLRGISFVQVPTTLLAAVDSSVGGKTAINSKFGKNLIGSFYQPKLVFCDLKFLDTLEERQFLSGYAEIVKYGLTKDRDFFLYLEENWQKVKNKDADVLQKITAKSCQIKAQIVALDERENGLRAILNFGHTFGHIFETETGYTDELFHGEAVAIGMVMAAQMSADIGIFDIKEVETVANHLQKVGLPIHANQIRNEWDGDNLVSHLYKDKKVCNRNLTFILLSSIGNAIIRSDIDKKFFPELLTVPQEPTQKTS